MPRPIPSKFQHLVMAAAIWAGCASAASPLDAQLARLYAEKRWPQALTLIEAELARNPGDVQRQLQKGVVLTNLNRQADALVVFRKLTVEHPELPGPYNNVAVLLAARGEFEQAREALERAIHTHPSYATAYENLGDLYSHMATDAYRKALRYDKQPANVRPRLALVDGLNGALVQGSDQKAEASTGSAGAAVPPGRTGGPTGPASAPAPAAALPAVASAAKTASPAQPTGPAPALATAPKPVTVAEATPPAATGRPPAATPAPTASLPAMVVAAASAPRLPAAPAVVGPVPARPAPDPRQAAPAQGVAQPARAGSAAPPPVAMPSAAAPPASAPGAAPAKAAATGGADDERALRQAVTNWAQAWSRRDMNGYFAAYSAEFKGKAKNHAAWRAERQDRITGKKRIEVVLSGITVKVQGSTAEVRFTQAYESDALRVVSPKLLNFEKIGGKWLIQQESASR